MKYCEHTRNYASVKRRYKKTMTNDTSVKTSQAAGAGGLLGTANLERAACGLFCLLSERRETSDDARRAVRGARAVGGATLRRASCIYLYIRIQFNDFKIGSHPGPIAHCCGLAVCPQPTTDPATCGGARVIVAPMRRSSLFTCP
jgi:hypothetical protein